MMPIYSLQCNTEKYYIKKSVLPFTSKKKNNNNKIHKNLTPSLKGICSKQLIRFQNRPKCSMQKGQHQSSAKTINVYVCMLGPYSINMLSIENHTTKEFCLISQDTSSTSDAAYKCYLYITQNILITLKSKIPVAAHIQTKQECAFAAVMHYCSVTAYLNVE